MTTYTRIDVAEFEEFLAAYDAERVDVRGVKEFVYDCPTETDGVVVRVFSTLTERDDGARDSGRDAIRVLAWSVTADTPLATATRTHRIETWRTNLAPKIESMAARIDAGEFDGETPDATLKGLVPVDDDEDAVVVTDLADTRYGKKAVLDSPYEAKDALKSLDWDDTHRSWDDSRDAWTVDATALSTVADTLADEGWPLRAPAMNPVDGFAFDAFTAAVREGDRVTVAYEQKNGNGEATKAGTVARGTAVDDDRVAFVRDDDHWMYVTEDGLFTTGSHHPYVGRVAEVRVSRANDANDADDTAEAMA